MHSSFSALDTFRTCPLKYKYQEIDKIRTPQSIELAFGSLIHKTLKYLYTPNSKGFPTREDAVNYFSQNWNDEVLDEVAKERGFFENGIKIIQDYCDKWEKGEEAKIVDIEHRFIIPIGEHTIGGAIDRIDKKEEGFEIIDYKTSRKIPPQDRIDNDLQLSIYLRAFIKEWPSLFENTQMDSVKLTLHFLRHNIRVSTVRNTKEMKLIDEEILGIIDNIEKAKKLDKFEPNLSALCDWCSYQKRCPLWKHKFKKEKDIDIEKQAKKYIQLKKQKSDIDKEIKEIQGNIDEYFQEKELLQYFTNDGSIVKYLRKSYEWNTQKVGEMITKWKKDPYEIMKVNGVELNRMLVKLPADKKREIMRLRKEGKETYGFSVKKK